VCCVIKANAYGHGIKEVASILKGKTDWFAVDNTQEALFLRSQGIQEPILVLGYTRPEDLKETVKNDISFVVYSERVLRKIVSLGLDEKAKVHLKVETGLNRQGLHESEILKLARYIEKNKGKIFLEGLSTHFANIEDTLDPSFANKQLERFKEALNLLKGENIRMPLPHAAASAGIFLYPKTHFKMVRVGIALYGLWPSRETKLALSSKKKSINLKPVLTWKTIVVQVKWIRKGESVGYGRTWSALRRSKIAIIPVGYFDGYGRKLSNNSRVLIKGKYVPIVGRVAMNMIMADVTENQKVKNGDEVILIGKSGLRDLTADELAEKLDTINYEVVTRINSTLPRIIV